jgi:sugar (pentulose or hexulose) kinase
MAPATLSRWKLRNIMSRRLAEQYLIGVDLGTSATKAALYRTDGLLVAEASQEVPLYYPRPGVVEQENDDFTSAPKRQRCLEKRHRAAPGGGDRI